MARNVRPVDSRDNSSDFEDLPPPPPAKKKKTQDKHSAKKAATSKGGGKSLAKKKSSTGPEPRQQSSKSLKEPENDSDDEDEEPEKLHAPRPRQLPESEDEDEDEDEGEDIVLDDSIAFKQVAQVINTRHDTPTRPRGEMDAAVLRRVGKQNVRRKAVRTQAEGELELSEHQPLQSVENNSNSGTALTTAKFTHEFESGLYSDKKPQARDYTEPARSLIEEAAREFEVFVVCKDGFPSVPDANNWANRCWKHACKNGDQEMALSSRMSSIIRGRQSRVRNAILTTVRDLVPGVYGFGRTTDEATTSQNVARYNAVRQSFAYEDPVARTGYLENPIFLEVFKAWAFEKGSMPGNAYEKLVCPVPLQCMALIMVAIRFVLDEWSTGRDSHAVKGNTNPQFTAKSLTAEYKTHLQSAKTWVKLNPAFTTSIREEMFAKAKRSSMAPSVPMQPQGLSLDDEERIKADMERRAAQILDNSE